MSESLILIFAAGTPVIELDGAKGVLAAPTAIDFGQISHDELAELFHQADLPQFMDLLTHTDADGRFIKYTPQGRPVTLNDVQIGELTQAQEIAAVIHGKLVENFGDLGLREQADAIMDAVARTTDEITSPSELAEALGITEEQLENLGPKPSTEGNVEASAGSPELSGSPTDAVPPVEVPAADPTSSGSTPAETTSGSGTASTENAPTAENTSPIDNQ